MGVMLAEHRLDRCLAAADRVLAFDAGAVAFDGDPHGFCDWVARVDPLLAPPGVELFSLAGIEPLPVSAKEARKTLAWTAPLADRPPDSPRAKRPRRGADGALVARDLWVELDAGSGPREVLRELDLVIAPGERVALMGRNGAGKSTLLRTATGLIEPVRGSVRTPRGCALLPQSPADLLVRERVGDELPGEEGLRALAAVGLDGAADADPRDLSGGERERLALAIVMAGRENGSAPGLVCFDEPTRGMDGARKAELGGWLAELATGGAAVLVATHDVEFAAKIATRVVLLGDGVVIADGAVDEILSGGWYFATEVARILGAAGAVTPEQGAELLASVVGRPTPCPAVADAKRSSRGSCST
jgi:energy-coupling factor transport system ATP-binding protein